MRRLVLLAVLAALAGCDANGTGSLMLNSAMDELRGPPSAGALSKTAHFEGAGLAFDYPAVLRERRQTDEDGDESWNFEYGMYTLEVYAPKSAIGAEAYVEALHAVFEGGERIDAKPPATGEPRVLCGEPRTPASVRVKLMGDWSEMEAWDLPAPAGEARLLIFDDELVDGHASALGRATRERVLSSLRCVAAP